MGKVQIKINNSLKSKNPAREDRKPTVYGRAIRKLTADGRHPGKLVQLYAEFNGDYKIFGIITLNTGGSISFFPDFYNLDNFDHLTLNKDFIRKKGHLTVVTDEGGRKKLFDFEADKLDTGDYHLITFVMKDGDLLMDSLTEIEFPEIEYKDEERDSFLVLLQNALHNVPYMITFPEEEGAYCIQILIVPKGKDIDKVSINTTPVEKMLLSSEPLANILMSKRLEIKTSESSDFSLCIFSFKVNNELSAPMGFLMTQSKK